MVGRDRGPTEPFDRIYYARVTVCVREKLRRYGTTNKGRKRPDTNAARRGTGHSGRRKAVGCHSRQAGGSHLAEVRQRLLQVRILRAGLDEARICSRVRGRRPVVLHPFEQQDAFIPPPGSCALVNVCPHGFTSTYATGHRNERLVRHTAPAFLLLTITIRCAKDVALNEQYDEIIYWW